MKRQKRTVAKASQSALNECFRIFNDRQLSMYAAGFGLGVACKSADKKLDMKDPLRTAIVELTVILHHNPSLILDLIEEGVKDIAFARQSLHESILAEIESEVLP